MKKFLNVNKHSLNWEFKITEVFVNISRATSLIWLFRITRERSAKLLTRSSEHLQSVIAPGIKFPRFTDKNEQKTDDSSEAFVRCDIQSSYHEIIVMNYSQQFHECDIFED